MKRRHKVRVAIVAAAVLLLVGWQGGRLVGDGSTERAADSTLAQDAPDQAVEVVSPARAPESVESVADSHVEAVPVDPRRADAAAAAEQLPVAQGSLEHAAEVIAADREPDLATIDRLSGCLSRIAEGERRRDFAFAWSALLDGRALELSEPQRVRVDAAERRIDQALQSALKSAIADVRSGRVLGAAEFLRLVCAGPPQLRARAEELAPSLVWDEFGDADGVSKPPSEQPGELEAGLRVRFVRNGETVTAVVAKSRGDRVSLRLEADGRVYFPVVSRAGLEPVESSFALALDQCVAALEAGDSMLAALWVLRARELEPIAGSDRLARLQSALRD